MTEQDEYKILFKKIAKTEYGTEQNLEEIERQLEHLRKGRALKYEDLETIADPKFWPFNKYWMWPNQSYIEKKLENNAIFFSLLPKEERKTIRRLNAIFKNISLVSIILRFARPDHYAIYSRPTLQILRIERGNNDLNEYLNYIEVMRTLKDYFQVKNVADVDQIVWAIFKSKNEQKKYVDELKEILSENLPKNLSAEDLMLNLSPNPLKLAEVYFVSGDFKTAGFWAAKAFEKFLDDELRRNGINIENSPIYQNLINKGRSKRLIIIEWLKENVILWNTKENQAKLKDTKTDRNKIIPGVKQFESRDVLRFIDRIKELQRIALHKGY